MSDSSGYSDSRETGYLYDNPSTGGASYYGRRENGDGTTQYVDRYVDKYGDVHTKVYNYDSHSSRETYYNSSYGRSDSSYNSYDPGK